MNYHNAQVMREIRRLARQITDLERDVRSQARASQARYRSLEDGPLIAYDDDGNPRTVIGAQADGSFTITDVNGTAPPVPLEPAVTPRPGVLVIESDGLAADGSAWPADFRRLEVHVGTAPGFTPIDSTQVAEWTSTRGGSVTLALDPGTYYVVLVAVNTSEVESVPSVEVEASPLAASTGAGGVQTFYENTEPLGLTADDDGAVWYDTSRDNLASRWDGAALAWVPMPVGAQALASVIELVSVLQTRNAAGDITFSLDGETGDVDVRGTLQTGAPGKRRAVLDNGIAPLADDPGAAALIFTDNAGATTRGAYLARYIDNTNGQDYLTASSPQNANGDQSYVLLETTRAALTSEVESTIGGNSETMDVTVHSDNVQVRARDLDAASATPDVLFQIDPAKAIVQGIPFVVADPTADRASWFRPDQINVWNWAGTVKKAYYLNYGAWTYASDLRADNQLDVGTSGQPAAGGVNIYADTKIEGDLTLNGDSVTQGWVSYAPTWGGTVGNGTLEGSYKKIGRTVHFRMRLVVGTTTTFGSGPWVFSLPIATARASQETLGTGVVKDSSASGVPSGVGFPTRNTANDFAVVASGGGLLSAANPFTWASGDTLSVSGTYEATS